MRMIKGDLVMLMVMTSRCYLVGGLRGGLPPTRRYNCSSCPDWSWSTLWALFLYILWLPPFTKTFQTWTRSPAQVLTLSLLLSSNTQRRQFGMIVVRVTLKKCCFPFLLTCSTCFCQTVSPHIFGTKLKSRLYTRKVQLHPHRIIACLQSMAVFTDFLQTWSGTCWWNGNGLLLNTKNQTHNLVSAPQGTPTNPSLFSLLQKRKNEGVHCFSGPPCCLRQYSKRETLETLQKLRLHNIWEISFKPCTQDASTFLLMATKLPGRLRPTKAWNRAAHWVPFCIPFIPMTLTDSWPCREVLPLPLIQFRSLIVIMLMTLLSLQTQLNV